MAFLITGTGVMPPQAIAMSSDLTLPFLAAVKDF
jgi:hypothetical protein